MTLTLVLWYYLFIRFRYDGQIIKYYIMRKSGHRGPQTFFNIKSHNITRKSKTPQLWLVELKLNKLIIIK